METTSSMVVEFMLQRTLEKLRKGATTTKASEWQQKYRNSIFFLFVFENEENVWPKFSPNLHNGGKKNNGESIETRKSSSGHYTVAEERNKWDTLVRRVVPVWLGFRTVSVVYNDDELIWRSEHKTSCHDNVVQQGRE